MWYALGTIIALVVVGLVWGIIHLRASQKAAYAAIRDVKLSDVDALRKECESVFRDSFGETLSLQDLERSARILSDRLDKVETLKQAFQKPEFYWYFVLPVGAYLGELLRVHAKAVWKVSDEGGVEMNIATGAGSATTFPFDKVMKQVTMGDKGDTFAYLMTATQLEKAVAQLPSDET